jgi:hypothetical protein
MTGKTDPVTVLISFLPEPSEDLIYRPSVVRIDLVLESVPMGLAGRRRTGRSIGRATP